MLVKQRSASEVKIQEETDRKKTYPELIFKVNIIEVHRELLEAEEVMNKFFEKSGKYNRVHVIVLKGKIIKLFKMIKEMIKKSKRLDSVQGEIYRELWRFSVHKYQTDDVDDLMRYVDFLIYYLDELNLTNLLLPSSRGFLDKMRDEY